MASGGSKSVFVGNLPFNASEQEVGEFFTQIGPVISVRLMFDKMTGRPRGFGFCEFESSEQAAAAVQQMNGQDFMGRQLRVDYTNDRQ